MVFNLIFYCVTVKNHLWSLTNLEYKVKKRPEKKKKKEKEKEGGIRGAKIVGNHASTEGLNGGVAFDG